MKKILFKTCLIIGLSTGAYASCNCDSSVSNNYGQITNKVPERFEVVEEKLKEISSELDKTIEEKEKEQTLLDKSLEAKQSLVVLHQKEIFQLEKMRDYIKNQNDNKILSSNIEIQKNQNVNTELQQRIEKKEGIKLEN